MKAQTHYLFLADRIEEDRLYLDSTESHHASSVLRLKKGDAMSVTDGFGQIFGARVESIEKQHLVASIYERRTVPRVPYDIEVYIGLPDRDNFEAALEGLTALGVRSIVPVENRYCQKPWWDEKWDKLSQRFRTKMVTAMKQCLYPYLPHLSRPVQFPEVCAMIRGQCIIADPEGSSIRAVVERIVERHVSVVVGPPGGFSADESSALRGSEGRLVRIAEARLRTELAAVVICSQLVGFWL